SAVRVFHQRIAVKAQIHTLGGFSAHAGQSQLLDWVAHFAHRPALYLIHGEREKMEALQGAIRERLDWDAEIPEPGERIEI
ncbi:MBL fold metallo-hydrolase, partial [Klebsiella pneumoniae]